MCSFSSSSSAKTSSSSKDIIAFQLLQCSTHFWQMNHEPPGSFIPQDPRCRQYFAQNVELHFLGYNITHAWVHHARYAHHYTPKSGAKSFQPPSKSPVVLNHSHSLKGQFLWISDDYLFSSSHSQHLWPSCGDDQLHPDNHGNKYMYVNINIPYKKPIIIWYPETKKNRNIWTYIQVSGYQCPIKVALTFK